jgi:hypothetical protein
MDSIPLITRGPVSITTTSYTSRPLIATNKSVLIVEGDKVIAEATKRLLAPMFDHVHTFRTVHGTKRRLYADWIESRNIVLLISGCIFGKNSELGFDMAQWATLGMARWATMQYPHLSIILRPIIELDKGEMTAEERIKWPVVPTLGPKNSKNPASTLQEAVRGVLTALNTPSPK